MARITFDVNNDYTLIMEQFEPDDRVFVFTENSKGSRIGITTAIPPQTMVMLWNLYCYIKGNDIQNDFINPNGKRKEV